MRIETFTKPLGLSILVCLAGRPLAAQVVSSGITAAASSGWDFSAATTLKVPSSGGAAPTVDGLVSFDSIAHNLVWGSNGATKTGASKSGTTVLGDCAKWDGNGNLVDSGAACGNGSGSGTVTHSLGALVNLNIMAGAGSADSQTSNITTDSGLNNLGVPGTVTTGTASGSPHGKVAMQELPSNGAATVGWESEDTITASLSLQFPNANPAANQFMLFPAPTGGISQWTWTTFASTNLTDTTNLIRNITVANASTTGTTLNALTSLTGAPSTAIVTPTTAINGVVGITTAGAGTSGSATVAIFGSVSCVFDGATTAGDYVQISSATAGDCHDAGSAYPANGQVVGRVLSTNGSAGTYVIDLFSSGIRAGTHLSVANASSTGTTLNTLTKLTGAPSTAVLAATSDAGGVIGVTLGGAGTSGNAAIATTGIVPCVFDNATTAGHYVQISSSVAGDCHDAGSSYPTSGQILGRVLSTNGAGGTYSMDLFASEIQGASGGGGGGLNAPSGNGPMKYTGASNTAQATADDLSGVHKCAAASGSGTAYTCTTAPTFSPAAQDLILFKADVASTGAVTLNVNSSSAAGVKKQGGGTALAANDLLAGQWTVLIYDGTNWQMQGLTGNAASGGGGGTLATTGVGYVRPFGRISYYTPASSPGAHGSMFWQFVCCDPGVSITVNTINWLSGASVASSFVAMGIFSDSSGTCNALLAQTTPISGAVAAGALLSGTLTSPVTLSLGTAYWIGFTGDTAGDEFEADGSASTYVLYSNGSTNPRSGKVTSQSSGTGTGLAFGSTCGTLNYGGSVNQPAMGLLP